MTHNDYQEHISLLIDGELAERDQPALFTHLSECGECRNFLSSTLALRSSLATSAQVSFPAGLDARMESVAANALVSARPAAFRLALAASIAFILLMGSLIFGPQMLKTTATAQPDGIVSTAPGTQPFPLPQQN